MRLPALLAALLLPAAAAAQSAAPTPAPAEAASPRPDIEFSATVRMESIRFDSAPGAGLRLGGAPRVETRHDVERDRLPAPVQAGRTYRDATVRTTFSATLLDPALAAGAGGAAPRAPDSPTPEDAP